jgi:hypothetical protein
MGRGPDAVLDPDLTVRGIVGLRVVDASVFPDMPSAHINAIVIAPAERASGPDPRPSFLGSGERLTIGPPPNPARVVPPVPLLDCAGAKSCSLLLVSFRLKVAYFTKTSKNLL